ncbi:hypothetical protein LZ32DRAFT_619966 [Colletotrichum eremochloae]|nr:hypothetical protein LZ32DRAFT_619966 [Colletotrichum eremochloae]
MFITSYITNIITIIKKEVIITSNYKGRPYIKVNITSSFSILILKYIKESTLRYYTIIKLNRPLIRTKELKGVAPIELIKVAYFIKIFKKLKKDKKIVRLLYNLGYKVFNNISSIVVASLLKLPNNLLKGLKYYTTKALNLLLSNNTSIKFSIKIILRGIIYPLGLKA